MPDLEDTWKGVKGQFPRDAHIMASAHTHLTMNASNECCSDSESDVELMIKDCTVYEDEGSSRPHYRDCVLGVTLLRGISKSPREF